MPNASQGDLFSYKLDYETAGYYDGNIGKQYWQASTNNAPTGIRTYTFTYDAASRLKTATYSGIGSESYGLPTVNYDRNGNITSLQRNGKLTSTYGLMDNLTYTYTGNRLMRVEDGIAGDYDVDFVNRNSGTDDYTYQANGALKSDKNEAINDIIYSTYVNQPIEMQLTSSRWIKNSYDGAGRLYKTSYSTGEYWEYLDGLVFKNGAFYQLATPEGRAVYQSGAWSYEYFHTDHLGNTRVAYKANGTALTKTSETSFDPWGIVLRDAGLVNAFQNRFEYQNKEKESTFNLRRIDFGARSYNASIGRFDRVDPLADVSRRFSPYTYVYNNPLIFKDPDGMFGDYYKQNGDYLGNDGKDDDKVYLVENDGVKSSKAENGIRTTMLFNSKIHDLGISHTSFLAFASLIHQESGGNKDESYGIANVSMNYLANGGSIKGLKTLEDISLYKNSFARGATQEAYSYFMGLSNKDRDSKFALEAALNAVGYSIGLPGTFDKTNGATGWDGPDLVSTLHKNDHRNYIWSSDSKNLLNQYQKERNGGINVSDFKYADSGYGASATAIICKTLYEKIHTNRTEHKAKNATRFK